MYLHPKYKYSRNINLKSDKYIQEKKQSSPFKLPLVWRSYYCWFFFFFGLTLLIVNNSKQHKTRKSFQANKQGNSFQFPFISAESELFAENKFPTCSSGSPTSWSEPLLRTATPMHAPVSATEDLDSIWGSQL